MRKTIKHNWLLLPFLGLLSACGDSQENSSGQDTRGGSEASVTVGTLVAGIAENQILSDLEQLTSSTQALVESAEQFCEEPEADALDTTKQAWVESAGAWYRVQLFNFGPADADPVFPLYTFIDSLRLRGTDYTESVGDTMAAWIESEEELDAEFFAEQRFNDVGLLAVEQALYASEDTVESYTEEPRRCEVLLGLTGALHNRAEELERGWTEDYNETGTPFVELLTEDELPNGREPLVQLVIAGQEYSHYLHNRGVASIAGKTSETGCELVELGLSAIDDLLSVDHGGNSIFYWMELLGDEAAVEKVSGDLEDAHAALEECDVEAFDAAVAALDGDFKREVPDSLEIELGLTLTDGD